MLMKKSQKKSKPMKDEGQIVIGKIKVGKIKYPGSVVVGAKVS